MAHSWQLRPCWGLKSGGNRALTYLFVLWDRSVRKVPEEPLSGFFFFFTGLQHHLPTPTKDRGRTKCRFFHPRGLVSFFFSSFCRLKRWVLEGEHVPLEQQWGNVAGVEPGTICSLGTGCNPLHGVPEYCKYDSASQPPPHIHPHNFLSTTVTTKWRICIPIVFVKAITTKTHTSPSKVWTLKCLIIFSVYCKTSLKFGSENGRTAKVKRIMELSSPFSTNSNHKSHEK